MMTAVALRSDWASHTRRTSPSFVNRGSVDRQGSRGSHVSMFVVTVKIFFHGRGQLDEVNQISPVARRSLPLYQSRRVGPVKSGVLELVTDARSPVSKFEGVGPQSASVQRTGTHADSGKRVASRFVGCIRYRRREHVGQDVGPIRRTRVFAKDAEGDQAFWRYSAASRTNTP